MQSSEIWIRAAGIGALAFLAFISPTAAQTAQTIEGTVTGVDQAGNIIYFEPAEPVSKNQDKLPLRIALDTMTDFKGGKSLEDLEAGDYVTMAVSAGNENTYEAYSIEITAVPAEKEAEGVDLITTREAVEVRKGMLTTVKEDSEAAVHDANNPKYKQIAVRERPVSRHETRPAALVSSSTEMKIFDSVEDVENDNPAEVLEENVERGVAVERE